jgi:hypothetical protein
MSRNRSVSRDRIPAKESAALSNPRRIAAQTTLGMDVDCNSDELAAEIRVFNEEFPTIKQSYQIVDKIGEGSLSFN